MDLKRKVCPSWESDKNKFHKQIQALCTQKFIKSQSTELTRTRAESIDTLVNNILPKGMFTLVGTDELVFNGGTTEWIHNWVNAIHEKSEDVNVGNVTHWVGAAYQLKKVINNPLGTDSHFYLSETTTQTYGEESAELMRMVCKLRIGERLYIGGIIDYHF